MNIRPIGKNLYIQLIKNDNPSKIIHLTDFKSIQKAIVKATYNPELIKVGETIIFDSNFGYKIENDNYILNIDHVLGIVEQE